MSLMILLDHQALFYYRDYWRTRYNNRLAMKDELHRAGF